MGPKIVSKAARTADDDGRREAMAIPVGWINLQEANEPLNSPSGWFVGLVTIIQVLVLWLNHSFFLGPPRSGFKIKILFKEDERHIQFGHSFKVSLRCRRRRAAHPLRTTSRNAAGATKTI